MKSTPYLPSGIPRFWNVRGEVTWCGMLRRPHQGGPASRKLVGEISRGDDGGETFFGVGRVSPAMIAADQDWRFSGEYNLGKQLFCFFLIFRVDGDGGGV